MTVTQRSFDRDVAQKLRARLLDVIRHNAAAARRLHDEDVRQLAVVGRFLVPLEAAQIGMLALAVRAADHVRESGIEQRRA